MSMKNPLTPSGTEAATIRFKAQHLNHCATAVPRFLVHLTIFQYFWYSLQEASNLMLTDINLGS